MTEFGFWPVLAVAVLVAMTSLYQRVYRAAQPLRLHLASVGEAFLARDDVSERSRKHVRYMLDHAFRSRSELIFGFFAVPVVAALTIFRMRAIAEYLDTGLRNPEVKAHEDLIARLHDRVTLANHPILAPLLELWILLFMPLAVLIRGAIKGRVPAGTDRDMVMNIIEDRAQTMSAPSWMRHAA
jgi:hypothetical protein